MVRAALLCLASAFLMAATPWPKDKPVAPVEYTSPEALKAVATTGILKAGEWSAKRSGNPKVSRAFKLAGAAADFPEIRDAWRKGDRVKAAFLLSWTMIKYGCPPADAADFAGRAVAAGTLAAKDATNQRQLDEAFASYKAASGGTGSDAWGWRQGFLSRSVRSELRKKHPDFSERDLDRMERVAMATYCENRLYRERFDGHKKQVRAWLKDGGVRWSGDEAALEKFLATMDEVERLIQARRAQDGLFDKERLRLAQAIFRGGKPTLDAALADYFTRYFGEPRDARGERPAAPRAPAPAEAGEWFRAKLPGGWKVEREGRGAWSARMERQIAGKGKLCRPQIANATVSAELKQGRELTRGDMDERLRAQMKGNGWYPEEGTLQDFSLGPFKGRLLITKFKYKAGAGNPSYGYRDGKAMIFGYAVLADGPRLLSLKYAAYAGSCWDNSGRAQAEREAKAAQQEAVGILRSLSIGPKP